MASNSPLLDARSLSCTYVPPSSTTPEPPEGFEPGAGTPPWNVAQAAANPRLAPPAPGSPEAMAAQQRELQRIARELLRAIGENPTRPELLDTPRRFAKMWQEFVNYDPGTTDTAFESAGSGQMVVVTGMRVWSLCEHHLLPFYCDVSVGYVARERILGLSKFARIAHKHAHRLQVQERLVTDIGRELEAVTGSPDVAVLARGEHLCMTMRGIRTPATMSSSYLGGAFRESAATRAEFMALAGVGK